MSQAVQRAASTRNVLVLNTRHRRPRRSRPAGGSFSRITGRPSSRTGMPPRSPGACPPPRPSAARRARGASPAPAGRRWRRGCRGWRSTGSARRRPGSGPARPLAGQRVGQVAVAGGVDAGRAVVVAEEAPVRRQAQRGALHEGGDAVAVDRAAERLPDRSRRWRRWSSATAAARRRCAAPSARARPAAASRKVTPGERLDQRLDHAAHARRHAAGQHHQRQARRRPARRRPIAVSALGPRPSRAPAAAHVAGRGRLDGAGDAVRVRRRRASSVRPSAQPLVVEAAALEQLPAQGRVERRPARRRGPASAKSVGRAVHAVLGDDGGDVVRPGSRRRPDCRRRPPAAAVSPASSAGVAVLDRDVGAGGGGRVDRRGGRGHVEGDAVRGAPAPPARRCRSCSRCRRCGDAVGAHDHGVDLALRHQPAGHRVGEQRAPGSRPAPAPRRSGARPAAAAGSRPPRRADPGRAGGRCGSRPGRCRSRRWRARRRCSG